MHLIGHLVAAKSNCFGWSFFPLDLSVIILWVSSYWSFLTGAQSLLDQRHSSLLSSRLLTPGPSPETPETDNSVYSSKVSSVTLIDYEVSPFSIVTESHDCVTRVTAVSRPVTRKPRGRERRRRRQRRSAASSCL